MKLVAPDQQYVAYYRVSTDRQGKSGLGLEAQRQAVREFLTDGASLLQEFTEIESGKKNSRPTLQQALHYCREHKATLLIAKLDRLGRNVAFVANLMESGVEFTAVDNPHASRLMIHLLAAFAEHEREQISKRTREALAAAKKRGVKLGEHAKPPEQRNHHRATLFAQKMKPLLAEIKAKGITNYRHMADHLNQHHIPAARGGEWSVASVYALSQRLHNSE